MHKVEVHVEIATRLKDKSNLEQKYHTTLAAIINEPQKIKDFIVQAIKSFDYSSDIVNANNDEILIRWLKTSNSLASFEFTLKPDEFHVLNILNGEYNEKEIAEINFVFSVAIDGQLISSEEELNDLEIQNNYSVLTQKIFLSYSDNFTGKSIDAKFIGFNKSTECLIAENGVEINVYNISSDDIYSLTISLLKN